MINSWWLILVHFMMILTSKFDNGYLNGSWWLWVIFHAQFSGVDRPKIPGTCHSSSSGADHHNNHRSNDYGSIARWWHLLAMTGSMWNMWIYIHGVPPNWCFPPTCEGIPGMDDGHMDIPYIAGKSQVLLMIIPHQLQHQVAVADYVWLVSPVVVGTYDPLFVASWIVTKHRWVTITGNHY